MNDIWFHSYARNSVLRENAVFWNFILGMDVDELFGSNMLQFLYNENIEISK